MKTPWPMKTPNPTTVMTISTATTVALLVVMFQLHHHHLVVILQAAAITAVVEHTAKRPSVGPRFNLGALSDADCWFLFRRVLECIPMCNRGQLGLLMETDSERTTLNACGAPFGFLIFSPRTTDFQSVDYMRFVCSYADWHIQCAWGCWRDFLGTQRTSCQGSLTGRFPTLWTNSGTISNGTACALHLSN